MAPKRNSLILNFYLMFKYGTNPCKEFTLIKKCWNEVNFPHILRFWHFPPWLEVKYSSHIWCGCFTDPDVCGFSSSNNRHLTDNVDFQPQIKCYQNLNNEVTYKAGNAHWNKTIATMWNIQRMPFMVAHPHYYNDFFGESSCL